jgi:hypothetical protein
MCALMPERAASISFESAALIATPRQRHAPVG